MLSVGTVRWFDCNKGYGFIERCHGIDVYVHFSAINREGYRSLEEGERVSYQLAKGKNGGLMAYNVTPILH